uniref:Integrase catalytic domain-containing protein n=1 Tax=Mycena chlorophos TaxID=658473 RepID=A0ABQ0LAX4_MYCCL|nr:predicted protein [Mycena chlorophos]
MFHFELHHVPATKFQAPDALSRRGLGEGEIAEDDDDSWLDEIVLLAQTSGINRLPSAALSLPSCNLARGREEINLREIDKFLRTLDAPNFATPQQHQRFIRLATQFMILDGNMFKRNSHGTPLRVILEPEARLRILAQAHDELGHKGVQALWEMLRTRFYWPKMRNDIAHHVASCHTCQVRNTRKMEIPATVSEPSAVFERVYIDVMNMPKAGRFTKIVAARDDLTGTCEAMAIKEANASTLARFFWTHIYCRYGCPRHVITDNGSEVKVGFAELMKRLGIPHIRISAYNKHATGVVERGHFTLREALVRACRGNLRKWPELLPLAVFADRITVSRITGYSPYQLLHGTDPVLPFDLAEATFLVSGFRTGMTTAELLALRIRQLSKLNSDVERATETLRKSRFQSRAHFEKRFKHRLQKRDYLPGELVLVRNVALENQVSVNRKTLERYLGPYQVVRKNRGGAYVLAELDGTELASNPTAAFRLLPYITRNHAFMKNGGGATTSDENESSEDSTSSESDAESA